MAVIELRDVSVVRSRSTLLSGINWAVNPDERWVIIGPNGAGKTTLLQICAAQMFPSRGTAWVLGSQLGRIDVFELRPRIGVSSAAMSDRIPKGELVKDVVVSAAYGVTGRWIEVYEAVDYDRADELMFQMRIDHLMNRTFGTLSEGERKRVQIARALMTDPELLLLDEPASGLDLAAREDLVDTISDICEDSSAPATVMVTHHVEEIPVAATHILMLNHGRVVVAGPINTSLNSETLSRAFEWPLEVNYLDGRWTAHTIRRASRAF
ncbi:MAG: ABC transporter ATP-binding protein [Propionibacteriaceae bacterium]|jgi:iron complex transport system ATP-binding protein|nr:ABC transporter ATP-binding protein [Propionibacteriaceae bacterium]